MNFPTAYKPTINLSGQPVFATLPTVCPRPRFRFRAPLPDLNEDQAAAVTVISAAAGNIRWGASRLEALGVPLPAKKARVVGALLARANELEELVMEHQSTDGGETANAIGDVYIELSGLLTYLKPVQIYRLLTTAADMARENEPQS